MYCIAIVSRILACTGSTGSTDSSFACTGSAATFAYTGNNAAPEAA